MFLLWVMVTAVYAQRPDFTKMSAMVRSLALDASSSAARVQGVGAHAASWLCAFVEIDGDGAAVLDSCGGESLARFGNIHIARIPVGSIARLSSLPKVKRIEANRSHRATLDTMAVILRADKAYRAESLPQAFTGKGVVVGVQDIGFDYTHPTFLDTLSHRCRISSVWDMLAADDGTMPVGATYHGDDVLACRHSADGNDQTHGTHTTGIAAGNGYRSAYRGVAYESDICLVANATGDNASMIPPERLYLYTYALDALGFKYLFDYAAERDMPCVASFSEGSGQDFRGDDRLYYQVLDSLVGPGRILVASAGNDGLVKTYFHKPASLPTVGSFLRSEGDRVSFMVRGNRSFEVRLVSYGDTRDTLLISSRQVAADTLRLEQWCGMSVMACAYPSAYEAADTVMDVSLRQTDGRLLSVEIVGEGTDASFYKSRGTLITNPANPSLAAGEYSHSIGSPASSPAAICVGSTAYRQDIYTYLGAHRVYDMGHDGERTRTSSIGPTVDERIKPDVMAPGTNIVSSYSSYYLEHHPSAWDIVNSDKEHFDFDGRTYAWNYNSGTSMSTPAAAGAIALWLQACPTLTPDQVRELIAATSRRHDPSLDYPNNYYGYGEIDVYAGLLRLLGFTAIPDVSQRQAQGVAIRPVGDGVELRFDSAPSHTFVVNVYGVDGRRVASHRLAPEGCSYHISLAGAPRGVYAVQVNTGSRATTGSQLIRH